MDGFIDSTDWTGSKKGQWVERSGSDTLALSEGRRCGGEIHRRGAGKVM